MRATLTGVDGATPSLTYKECGPSNFEVSSFGVDLTGTFVFWPTTADGTPGHDYSKVGDDPSKATELPKVKYHQVMAARLRVERFSDPFVFCEIGHQMDSIVVVGSNTSEAMTFVSSEILDAKAAKAAKANLWFTSMPSTRCINVVGVTCVAPVAFPGQDAQFDLIVRNDGNTYVSGFTACLRETGKKEDLSKTAVTFSAKTLMESGYNPKGSGGKLQNVEDDYALAPGRTAVYRVAITIPKGWSGEKKVSVTAKDVVLADGKLKANAMFAQAEEAEGLVYDSESYVEFDDSESIEYVVAESQDVGDEDYDEGREPFDILDVWYEDNLDVNDDAYDYDIVDAPVLIGAELPADEDKKDGGNQGNNGNNGNGTNGGSGGYSGYGPAYTGFSQGRTVLVEGAPGRRVVANGRSGFPGTFSPVTGSTPVTGGNGSTAVGTSPAGTAPVSGGAGTAGTIGVGGGVAGGADTGAGPVSGISTGAANPVAGGVTTTVGTLGTTVSQASAIPATGDDGTSHLPLGIALAGAGLLAYSRRRERLERKDAERD